MQPLALAHARLLPISHHILLSPVNIQRRISHASSTFLLPPPNNEIGSTGYANVIYFLSEKVSWLEVQV